MLAYYLLVGIPLVLELVMYAIKRTYRMEQMPGRKLVIWSFFWILFFLLALRASHIGTDTWNYLAKFRAARNSSWGTYVADSSSKGFAVLNKLIGLLTGNDQIYLALIAAITVFPLAKLYGEKSESPILTISLFLILPVFTMSFSGLRQAIAIAMVPLAYRYVQERKIWSFLLLVALTSTVHLSAWLILTIYPVYHLNLGRKSLIWITPVLLGVYLFNDQIYLLILSLGSSIYAQRYSTVTQTGATTMLYLFVIILVFSYVFLEEKDEETNGLRNIMILTVALQCFALVNRIAMRMNYYNLVFLPLLLPKIIRRMSRRNKWFGTIVEFVCCGYFLYYFMEKSISGTGGLNIFPYVPFWNA